MDFDTRTVLNREFISSLSNETESPIDRSDAIAEVTENSNVHSPLSERVSSEEITLVKTAFILWLSSVKVIFVTRPPPCS